MAPAEHIDFFYDGKKVKVPNVDTEDTVGDVKNKINGNLGIPLEIISLEVGSESGESKLLQHDSITMGDMMRTNAVAGSAEDDITERHWHVYIATRALTTTEAQQRWKAAAQVMRKQKKDFKKSGQVVGRGAGGGGRRRRSRSRGSKKRRTRRTRRRTRARRTRRTRRR
jgi:hypothetical protein